MVTRTSVGPRRSYPVLRTLVSIAGMGDPEAHDGNYRAVAVAAEALGVPTETHWF